MKHNENKITTEGNTVAPAAEDEDSYTEISAEDMSKLEENFYRKRGKEVDLIIQNLREALENEKAKLKHIEDMQKDAWEKMLVKGIYL